VRPAQNTEDEILATSVQSGTPLPPGMEGLVSDWASDQQAFKGVPWGKAMMWIFLLSDTFIFACFLVGYMKVRVAATDPWPDASQVFALTAFGVEVPLLLIAIMTFILISSSGTMALAVKYAYQKDKTKTFWLMIATAVLGASFVGMQVFEWGKLIEDGVRPWGNPFGAEQFGATFFLITGFHGTHVSIGVIFLFIMAFKVRRGSLESGRPGFLTGRKGRYEMVETVGLYWHFVDLVWVFIFAFFYLW
jgi:cytochrome c oxidase subunit III